MVTTDHQDAIGLDQLTKRAVRAFWMDGLWDLVMAGMMLIFALWGAVYVKFVAFPSWTWPFLQNINKNVVWIGLLILVCILIVYIWNMWIAVKKLKNRLIYPHTGFADHRFFMPIDPKVFRWYAFLYIAGLLLLFGLFYWIKGGMIVMSIPFLISPAAILIGIGWFYDIRRYLWVGGIGLGLSVLLELLITTRADYLVGQRNFLDTLPQWGSPTLPCLVWAGLFIVSGLIGFINVRFRDRETKTSV
jgi:hypothetical protein